MSDEAQNLSAGRGTRTLQVGMLRLLWFACAQKIIPLIIWLQRPNMALYWPLTLTHRWSMSSLRRSASDTTAAAKRKWKNTLFGSFLGVSHTCNARWPSWTQLKTCHRMQLHILYTHTQKTEHERSILQRKRENNCLKQDFEPLHQCNARWPCPMKLKICQLVEGHVPYKSVCSDCCDSPVLKK